MNSRVPLASACLLALWLLPATRQADAAAGRGGNPQEAARVAVLAATASFEWCDTAPRLADRLVILDLVGMAAWLRAHGVESPGPTDTEAAVSGVATALR